MNPSAPNPTDAELEQLFVLMYFLRQSYAEAVAIPHPIRLWLIARLTAQAKAEGRWLHALSKPLNV